MKPSYSKELRERAKREGEYLVTVDFVGPSGKREMCAQGPMTRDEARTIVSAWAKVFIDRQKKKEAPCSE